MVCVVENKNSKKPKQQCKDTKKAMKRLISPNTLFHGLRTPREEIAFTARPKIHSHSQSIFCLPNRPNFSDGFDLCLHWVSVVGALFYIIKI